LIVRSGYSSTFFEIQAEKGAIGLFRMAGLPALILNSWLSPSNGICPGVSRATPNFSYHLKFRLTRLLTQKSDQEKQQATAFATVLGGMITSVSIGLVPRPDEVELGIPLH
jgi:hypothetical protein